jgi:ATP-dependent RNA helicase DeaD
MKSKNTTQTSQKAETRKIKIIEPSPPLPDYAMSDLPEPLSNAVKSLNWKNLFPVQIKAIPYILNAQDIIVQSKTGSGKTGAFAIPLLQVIESQVPKPQALIMVPTRELAKQVHQEFQNLAANSNINCTAIYGGVGYANQFKALQKGAHVVVGTPGRILDHLIRGTLQLDCLRDLILDEADKMLSMGFYPDMKRVQAHLPRERCSYMFSATIPMNVRRLANEFLKNPKFLSLCPSNLSISNMDHVYYTVKSMDKEKALLRIIEEENPETALIFCNTKRDVKYLSVFLTSRGLMSGMLSSDLEQSARERVLKDLKARKLRFLVATDVAARGIDIKNLSHVILYDLPEDPESYVHRSGRTARAGNRGVAISITTELEEVALKRTEKEFGIHFLKRELKCDAELENLIRERASVYLEQNSRHLKPHELDGAKRMLPLLDDLMNSEDEKLALGMLLHSFYWKKFTKAKKRGDDF